MSPRSKTSSKSLPNEGASSAHGPSAVGVTKDGVRILKSKGKATHFTAKEIREAVAAARAKSA